MHHRLKQKFTTDEDALISSMVAAGGPKKWRAIAQQLKGRTAQQCRERWVNYLSPGVRKDPWSDSEDRLLREKVAEAGHQWSRIAGFFDGRTDVSLKHRYLKLMRRDRKLEKKRQKMGSTAPAAIGSDDEGGAFWLEDQNDCDEWDLELFDEMSPELSESEK